jgi:uncharacterized membrane protein
MRLSAFKVLALVIALLLVGVLAINSHSRAAYTLLRGAGTLKIQLDGLAPGDVRAFCYTDQAGRRLQFLPARDLSGKVHTAFDACRQCYKYHDGYTWVHGYLICRLYGNRYRIKNMSVGKGSCVPVRLASKTVGDQVRIKVKDVEAGRWLF